MSLAIFIAAVIFAAAFFFSRPGDSRPAVSGGLPAMVAPVFLSLPYPGGRTLEPYKAFTALLLRKSTGARRKVAQVAALDPLILKSALRAGISPTLLEGIVLLESGGDVLAGSSAACYGVAQFSSATARGVGLKADPAAVRRYFAAARRGDRKALKALQQADHRFVPAKALPAAARHLASLTAKYGDESFAAAAYHMGEGNLNRILALYGKRPARWDDVLLDATPGRHPKTAAALAALKDGSATYWWRVQAAAAVLRLAKRDPSKFAAAYALANPTLPGRRWQIAMEPSWYPERGQFADADALHRALAAGTLLPAAELLAPYGVVIDPGVGSNAAPAKKPLYRLVRPQLAALIANLAGEYRRNLRNPAAGLTVTSLTRSTAYQRTVGSSNDHFSGHASGWSADFRLPGTASGRYALEAAMECLRIRGDAVWIRERSHYHLTVSPEGAQRFSGTLTAAR